MNIDKTGAWALARVRDGYPVPPALTGGTAELANSLAALPDWKSREWLLRSMLSPEQYELVGAADSAAPPPGLVNQAAPPTPEQRKQWALHPAGYLSSIPAPNWLLKDRVTENGITVLFGPSGTYKTFVGLDWALRVAQTRRAIYTIYEGRSGYWPRIRAWERHNKATHKGVDPDRSTGLFVVDGTLPVMEGGHLFDFIAEAKALKPSLVVIDTLARAMTGFDENSTRDMGLFVAAADAIRQGLNSAVVIVHHTGRNGGHERGSTALRGAVDMMIAQQVDEDGTIVQECVKSKDAEPFEPAYFRPVSVDIEDQQSVPVLVDASLVIRSDKLTPNQRKVLDAMSLTLFEDGITTAEVVDSTGLPRGSVYRILDRLLDLDLIQQDSKRAPYRLTDKGRNTALDGKPQLLPKRDDSQLETRSLGAEYVTAPDYYEAGL